MKPFNYFITIQYHNYNLKLVKIVSEYALATGDILDLMVEKHNVNRKLDRMMIFNEGEIEYMIVACDCG